MRLSKTYAEIGVIRNDTCRLCLRIKVSSKPIFAKTETSERLRVCILDCCPVTLFEDDRLPNVICDECEKSLIATFEFRERCRESERRLRLCYGSSYSNVFHHALSSNYKILRDRSVQTDNRTYDRPTEESFDFLAKDKKNKNRKTKQRKRSRRNSIADGDQINSRITCDESERSEEEKDEKAVEDRVDEYSISSSKTRSEFSEERKEDAASRLNRVDPDSILLEIEENAIVANTDNHEGSEKQSKTPDEPKKRYLCHVCSKTFVSNSGLQLHLKSHIGKKPYLCRYCGKGFVIPSYARRHEQIHSGNKCFVCEYCSAAFVSLNGLRYHQRSHTGKANFRCNTCGKAFHRSKYLKEHIFTHTGEKPYVCKICDSAYGNSGSLFVHEKKCKARLLSLP